MIKKILKQHRIPVWKMAVLFGTVLFCLIFIHSTLEKSKVISIEPGETLSDIAAKLEQEDIIYSKNLFKTLTYATGTQNQLKSGEYFFPVYSSLWSVKNILVSGKTISYRITIPEGLTVKQITEILEQDDRLTGEITESMKDGYLLPDTYFFTKGTSKNAIIVQMKNAMDKVLDEEWEYRANYLPLKNKNEALALASIIEKETSIAGERAIVSSVFVNRLKKGMRLQTDPTVVYAITNGYGHMRGKRLLRKHLKVNSSYNTYRNKGLPPAPIANPGRAAIYAALHPAQTKYLYFVADGTGGHVFAQTYDQHNKNRVEWQKIRKEIDKENKSGGGNTTKTSMTPAFKNTFHNHEDVIFARKYHAMH